MTIPLRPKKSMAEEGFENQTKKLPSSAVISFTETENTFISTIPIIGNGDPVYYPIPTDNFGNDSTAEIAANSPRYRRRSSTFIDAVHDVPDENSSPMAPAQLYSTMSGRLFHSGRIAIVLVGPPARGKTYVGSFPCIFGSTDTIISAISPSLFRDTFNGMYLISRLSTVANCAGSVSRPEYSTWETIVAPP